MIIESAYIKKFRGFNDAHFKLGANLTVIAGQNGTQKTTLLGILSQSFTLTDQNNPLYGEKPLCGGNYRSTFAEKFKLSDSFDKAKTHEWSLNLKNVESEYTIESIPRGDDSNGIRFWKKGDKSKGSGYIQLPVIYLSLSRLFPIGEDTQISSSNEISIDHEEFNFYKDWHNEILIIRDVEMTSADYLASKQKNTLGANTSYYDWKMNSAGQDNIGKIILAVLSFKRLKKKYENDYKGGILAIDEIDATLYPASQIKLIEALRKFSSSYNIQIIFTTHSLTMLKKLCEWQSDPKISGQVKVVYLQKFDNNIKAIEDISFDGIKNRLNIAISDKQNFKKIPVFTEDKEGAFFLKSILKRRNHLIKISECTMGCSNYIELIRKKVEGFKYLQSIVVLDGDVKSQIQTLREISKHKHILLLPGENSPERLIANFLYNLSDESPIWRSINAEYNKQFVFRDYSIQQINGTSSRELAKKWFNTQKKYWGRNCSKVMNPWINENKNDVDSFIKNYDKLLEKYNCLL